MISGGSKSAHYSWSLCSLLFGKGQEILGANRSTGTPIERGQIEKCILDLQIEKCILDLDSDYMMSLQVLSCSGVCCSTGWQSLESASHPPQY